MITLVMITLDVLGRVPEVPLAERNDAMETFLFDGPTKRSAWAFAFGARHGVCTTQMPPSLNSSRTAPLRVSIANQYAMRAQQPVIRHRQRATDLPHEQLVGRGVDPSMLTRRDAKSMTNTV